MVLSSIKHFIHWDVEDNVNTVKRPGVWCGFPLYVRHELFFACTIVSLVCLLFHCLLLRRLWSSRNFLAGFPDVVIFDESMHVAQYADDFATVLIEFIVKDFHKSDPTSMLVLKVAMAYSALQFSILLNDSQYIFEYA